MIGCAADIANFFGMVRISGGIGAPMNTPVAMVTAEVR
ncbi:MAG: hypothetical protein ACJAS2_001929 [Pseudohongiellaceae bacterium]|jgi:hypothetical protein